MEWLTDRELDTLDDFLRGNAGPGSGSAFLATMDAIAALPRLSARERRAPRAARRGAAAAPAQRAGQRGPAGRGTRADYRPRAHPGPRRAVARRGLIAAQISGTYE